MSNYTLKELQKFVPLGLCVARKRSDLTLDQAAAEIGISSQALQKHEKGYNLPQLEVFLKELTTYGLDFASFHQLLLEVKVTQRVKALEKKVQALAEQLQQEG